MVDIRETLNQLEFIDNLAALIGDLLLCCSELIGIAAVFK